MKANVSYPVLPLASGQIAATINLDRLALLATLAGCAAEDDLVMRDQAQFDHSFSATRNYFRAVSRGGSLTTAMKDAMTPEFAEAAERIYLAASPWFSEGEVDVSDDDDDCTGCVSQAKARSYERDLSPLERPFVTYNALERYLRNTLAELHLIVDGTMPNKDQNRAVKRMVAEKLTALAIDMKAMARYAFSDPTSGEEECGSYELLRPEAR